MKTLNSHVIVYDDECPMCRAYSAAFVKTGMLDGNGRRAYSKIEKLEMPQVDWERARNEIALVDTKSKSVTYGIESLLTIVGNSLPVFRPLFSVRLFQYIIERFYMFISYNRKVLSPSNTFEMPGACTPDLNYPYRWAYIIFAWTVTSFVLASYSRLLVPLAPASNFYTEFLVCGGKILLQGGVVWVIDKKKVIHYLGNMITVSLIGALALLPAFALTAITRSGYFYTGYVVLVVMLLFVEHVRRVGLLQLPWFVTGTWVTYRCIVLYIILS